MMDVSDIDFNKFFVGSKAKNNRQLVTHLKKYQQAGILTEIENVDVVMSGMRKLHPEVNQRTLGQYTGFLSNFLGKLVQHKKNVTLPHGHTTLKALDNVPRERLEHLHHTYCGKAKELQNPAKADRKEGKSSPREKNDFNWGALDTKSDQYYKKSAVVYDKTEPSSTEVIQLRNALLHRSVMMMPNIRSRIIDIKYRDYDPLIDNYIRFSGEPYGDTVISWNQRKGAGGINTKQYNQTIPEALAMMLRKYVTRFAQTEYMFSKDDGANMTKEHFGRIIQDINLTLIGRRIGASDMRRVQITKIGFPSTVAELERLAVQFHHSASEHRHYFRKEALEAQEDTMEIDG